MVAVGQIYLSHPRSMWLPLHRARQRVPTVDGPHQRDCSGLRGDTVGVDRLHHVLRRVVIHGRIAEGKSRRIITGSLIGQIVVPIVDGRLPHAADQTYFAGVALFLSLHIVGRNEG